MSLVHCVKCGRRCQSGKASRFWGSDSTGQTVRKYRCRKCTIRLLRNGPPGQMLNVQTGRLR